MIDIEDVSVHLGDLPILRDVSLSIDPGTLVGIVGPNGAGKTTLLRTISTAVRPTTGRVIVDGTNVHDLASRDASRLVSVVPQDTAISFAFDVRDVVAMGRLPHRGRFTPPSRSDRRIVADAMDRTGIDHLAERSIDAISGGERQRVLIARSIAQDTPVTLFDEPTASLDINYQVETMDLVRELVDEGKTAIAAIHDLDLAARYCDELVLLGDGRVLATGPPADVLTTRWLDETFDAVTAVTRDPTTGRPTVTALSPPDRSIDARVHVVGSGAVAARAVTTLTSAGARVSLGPVTHNAIAADVASHCGADVIGVEPYLPIDAPSLEAVSNAVTEADVLVLADLELSAGNQLLLDVIDDATILTLEERTLEARNHAGEEAARRYERLLEGSTIASSTDVVDSVASLLERMDQSDCTEERAEPNTDEKDAPGESREGTTHGAR